MQQNQPPMDLTKITKDITTRLNQLLSNKEDLQRVGLVVAFLYLLSSSPTMCRLLLIGGGLYLYSKLKETTKLY